MACLKNPNVLEKFVENGEVALKCLLCDEIVRNINNLQDVMDHTNKQKHQDAVKVSLI